jgi:16S rRNA (cytidine1402-2'-O)-methyltransferase
VVSDDPSPGTLFVVSTPIGHLGDLSHRAIEVLGTVSAILAEDTRHTRHLLDRYGITTPMRAYHEHNEAQESARAVARLVQGETLALVSDAGTPLLSDPGARLVRAAIVAGVPVSPVPGASALLAALVGAGLDADRFTFFGFLPRKGADRTAAIRDITALAHTSVLYEAPSRVAPTLYDLAAAGGGERQAVVARELTKQFEEFRRGTVGDLAAYYEASPPRGEVVLMIGGAPAGGSAPSEEALRMHVRELRAAGTSARDITTALIDAHGVARNVAYRLAHEA